MSSPPVAPECAEAEGEAQEHPHGEEVQDKEEEKKVAFIDKREELSMLLQRKKLVQDLRVVNQIEQLLQGHGDRAGAHDCLPHHRQHRKVRPAH